MLTHVSHMTHALEILVRFGLLCVIAGLGCKQFFLVSRVSLVKTSKTNSQLTARHRQFEHNGLGRLIE